MCHQLAYHCWMWHSRKISQPSLHLIASDNASSSHSICWTQNALFVSDTSLYSYSGISSRAYVYLCCGGDPLHWSPLCIYALYFVGDPMLRTWLTQAMFLRERETSHVQFNHYHYNFPNKNVMFLIELGTHILCPLASIPKSYICFHHNLL